MLGLNGRRNRESRIKTSWVLPFVCLRGLGLLIRGAMLFINPIYSNVFYVLCQIFISLLEYQFILIHLIKYRISIAITTIDHDRTKAK